MKGSAKAYAGLESSDMFRVSIISFLIIAVIAGLLAFGLSPTRGEVAFDLVFVIAAGAFVAAVVRTMTEQIRVAVDESAEEDRRSGSRVRAEVRSHARS